jgi:hypothetical protein
MTIAVLFDLPKELVLNVLLEFLSLKDVSLLDAACCSHGLRPVLLSWLSDKSCCLKRKEFGILSGKLKLTWLWKRRIGIEAIKLPCDSTSTALDFDLLKEFLQLEGNHVTYVGEEFYDVETYNFYDKLPIHLNPLQLLKIAQLTPNLRMLDNLSTQSVSLPSMATLRNRCRGLEHLSIQHITLDSFDPSPMLALLVGGNCVIQYLRLPSMNNYMAGFSVLAENCPHLRSLRFDRSRDIPMPIDSDEMDLAFASLSRHCPQLQSLWLPVDCPVVDSALFALTHANVSLESIKIPNCSMLTSSGLLQLSKCIGLKDLYLAECTRISDDGVKALAEKCPHLQHVSLKGASQITDEAIVSLAGNCGGIRYLNISYCEKLTSESLAAIGEGCELLHSLDVTMCNAMDDSGVLAIAHGCPGLRRIGLCNCNWLSNAAVLALVERCPSLKEQGGASISLLGSTGVTKDFRGWLEDAKLLNHGAFEDLEAV